MSNDRPQEIELEIQIDNDDNSTPNLIHISTASTSEQQEYISPTSKEQEIFLQNKVIGGLTTEEAKQKLTTNLEQCIKNLDKETGHFFKVMIHSIWRMINMAYKKRDNITSSKWEFFNFSGFVLMLTLVISFSVFAVACGLMWSNLFSNETVSREYIRVLVECIILFLVFWIYVIGSVVKNWREKVLLLQLLKSRYKDFLKSEIEFSEKETNIYGIESMPFIAVCRDGKWIKLPLLLIVDGDLVFTHFKDKDLDYLNAQYELTENENFYMMKETLLARMITDGLHAKISNKPEFLRTQFFSNIFAVLAIIAIPIVEIVNIIHYFISDRHDWIQLFLLHPIYVILPLEPVAFPIFLLLLFTIANSRVLALSSYLQKQDKKLINSIVKSASNSKEKHKSISIPLGLATKYFFKALFGLSKKGAIINDVLAIGAVNCLCCVDKDGILCDSLYVPEKLLMVRTVTAKKEQTFLPDGMMENYLQMDKADLAQELENSQQKQEDLSEEETRLQNDSVIIEEVPKGELVEHEEISIETEPEIFTLQLLLDATEQNESSIHFEDENWQEYINLLKPLGLNCLINSSSRFDTYKKSEQESFSQMYEDFRPLWKKYIFQLATEMGFSDSVLDSFIFKKRIYTNRAHMEISSVIVDYDVAGMQLHSHGHPSLILDYCTDYWDGKDLKPLDDKLKNQILSDYYLFAEKKGLYCIGLAYKPIEEKYYEYINANTDNPVCYIEDESKENPYNSIQKGQIFLGLVALRKPIKKDLPEFIRDLGDDSGIRFIYMSSWNTQKTKAIGDKLGLETEWNSCISLKDCEVELDESDLRAKLPHGIEAIKKHIVETDNVPLLVSLFSDATPKTTQEMFQVLQQNNEIICCAGSSTCIENPSLFSQGNVSISIDPFSSHDPDDDKKNRLKDMISSYSGFAELLSFPSAFHIKNPYSENSFQIIFHLIKEGRRMLANIKQGYLFFIGANFCLFAIQLLQTVLMMPPVFDGISLLWLMIVIIPILSISLLFNPIEPNIMNLISPKNSLKRKQYYTALLYTVFKFILAVPLVVFVHTFAISSTENFPVSWTMVFGGQIPNQLYISQEYQSILIHASNISMLFLVFYYIVLSVTFINRLHSIFKVFPIHNYAWVSAVLLCILLQVIYTLISSLCFGYPYFPNMPFYVYLIALIIPIFWIVLDELIKIRVRKLFFINQVRLKLKFGTKLGMYSPK